MSRRDRLLRRLEQRWIACFGEPPSLRCDPDLMAELLDEAESRRERAGLSPAASQAAAPP
jgi:hypothetical protein